MGLGSKRGGKFTLSSKVKGRVLGICVLYDTSEIVLLFVPLLMCFWLNLYSVDDVGKLVVATPSAEITRGIQIRC
jgi:hypothetical protein